MMMSRPHECDEHCAHTVSLGSTSPPYTPADLALAVTAARDAGLQWKGGSDDQYYASLAVGVLNALAAAGWHKPSVMLCMDYAKSLGSRAKPGSAAAITLGCSCPVADNNNGKYPPRPPAGWWYDAACPLHSGLSSKRPKKAEGAA